MAEGQSGRGDPPPEDKENKEMSKRAPMLLAAIAVMVALFATAAYAAEIHGTEKEDFLTESQRGDTITALAGDDTVDAAADFVNPPGGPGDRDIVHGNKGDDKIELRDGDGKDIAYGGKGTLDYCWGDTTDVGDGGDKFFGCEYINDVKQ